jgi:predicted nucleic acid-binding protein
VIDSSGWIEYFVGGPHADRFACYLGPNVEIVTPTIVLYEVYKKIKRERGEEMALLITGRLNATEVIPLTASLALNAADISMRHGLAMADAIVYATSVDREAQLITGDADLRDLPGVIYFN